MNQADLKDGRPGELDGRIRSISEPEGSASTKKTGKMSGTNRFYGYLAKSMNVLKLCHGNRLQLSQSGKGGALKD